MPRADDSDVARAFQFQIHAFDWNCQQHITPRFTVPDIEQIVAALQQRITTLEAENQKLREKVGAQAE